MSFTNPAPLGGYITGDLIDESEINYWCSVLPDCIDGAGGGTYTLSNPLIINGDDVTFGANLDVGVDLSVGDDLVVGDHLSVGGDAVIGDDLTVTDDAGIGGDLTVTGSANVGVDLNVTGDVTIDGTIFGAGINGSTLQIASTTTIGGATTFLFKVNLSPNADHTYAPTDANQVYFAESVSAHRTYTFSGTFDAGQWFIFKHRAGGGQTLTVNGLDLVVTQAVLWIYTGTVWRAMTMSEAFA